MSPYDSHRWGDGSDPSSGNQTLMVPIPNLSLPHCPDFYVCPSRSLLCSSNAVAASLESNSGLIWWHSASNSASTLRLGIEFFPMSFWNNNILFRDWRLRCKADALSVFVVLCKYSHTHIDQNKNWTQSSVFLHTLHLPYHEIRWFFFQPNPNHVAIQHMKLFTPREIEAGKCSIR